MAGPHKGGESEPADGAEGAGPHTRARGGGNGRRGMADQLRTVQGTAGGMPDPACIGGTDQPPLKLNSTPLGCLLHRVRLGRCH